MPTDQEIMQALVGSDYAGATRTVWDFDRNNPLNHHHSKVGSYNRAGYHAMIDGQLNAARAIMLTKALKVAHEKLCQSYGATSETPVLVEQALSKWGINESENNG